MWKDRTRKSSKRFTHLLLEDGDHYIQDWIASCRPGLVGPGAQQPSQQRRLKGRLRLCSRAIFFEPDYMKAPILMFPLAKVKKIEQLALPSPTTPTPNRISKWKEQQEGFVVETRMLVKMKEDGIDAPYVLEKKDSIWWFNFEFAPVQQFLHQAQSLLSINSLSFAERDMILQNAAAQREAKAQFDISRLVDLSEQVLLDCLAAQVTPLVREPGRLVLTQARIYFQPLHNLNNDSPVRSQPHSEVLAVACRRHSLRPVGMEIFFNENSCSGGDSGGGVAEGASAFFTFHSTELRDKVVSMFLQQLGGQSGAAAAAGSLLEADSAWLHRVTEAWQARLVSNYDYLMYLNLAAGRSFCDLTQWPIMPWVLCDYKSPVLDLADPAVFRDLSKPIGALNPARLSVFLERFSQMSHEDSSHPPFLYGTHYSTPGYVLYWLVRAAPAHMLRLQNGRFDSPDRLFTSVADSWDSVLQNPADLKELIPEFYAPPSDFLLKREGLNLGVRQSGEPVGDVKLPPWAKDPEDFISKHRQALESQHVSMRLHLWIDLIFGYKQQGEAALAANNLYHHLTYEGAVNLESIDDPVERAGLEAQINEFGQAPRQLFTTPHPPRLLRRKATIVDNATLSNYSIKSEGFRGLSMEFVSRIMALASSHAENPTPEPTILSAGVKFQIPAEPSRAKPSSDRPLGAQRKFRPGTPLPSAALRSATEESESDTEDSILASTSNVADFERSLGNESLSETSTPGIESLAAEDPFDVIRDVEIRLPNLLKKTSKKGKVSFPEEVSPKECEQQKSDVHECLAPQPTPTKKGKVSFPEDVSPKECEQQKSDVHECLAPQPTPTKKGTGWQQLFRKDIAEPQCIKLHRGPVNALVISEENAASSLTMYSVGKDGFIKVYSVSEGFQVRATKLGSLPLSCLTLARSADAYPTVLAGSYDDCVYIYSVDYGRALGKMRVHDDTVSCVRMKSHSSQQMVTASWDSTVKIWSIAEGRGSSVTSAKATAMPEAEFLEHDSAIWSLDVEPEGNLAVSGAEDGTIIAWDLRSATSCVWQSSTGSSAAGLRLTSDANQVVVASTDGSLRVLEMRRAGDVLATKECGNPLRCCEIAENLIIAGSTDGSLHFWSTAFPTSGSTSEETKPVQDHLDYTPIRDHTDSVNCLSLAYRINGSVASFATSSDDSNIYVYSARK